MWPQTWLPGRDLDFGPCSALLGHPGGLTQWRLSPGFAQRLLGRTQPPDPAWIGGGIITDPEGARARQWDLVAYRRAVVCHACHTCWQSPGREEGSAWQGGATQAHLVLRMGAEQV